MSSSLRPRTLRAKLVIGQMALALALCVVMGGVAVLAVREFLVRDLDGQVMNLFKQGGPGRPGVGYSPGINAFIDQDGSISGTIELPSDNGPRALTGDESAVLANAPAGRQTLDMGEKGEFRVATKGRQIKGLPTTSVTDGTWQMIWVLIALTIAGTAGVALVGRVIVRRALVLWTASPTPRPASPSSRCTRARSRSRNASLTRTPIHAPRSAR